jgi:hypothetical protein
MPGRGSKSGGGGPGSGHGGGVGNDGGMGHGRPEDPGRSEQSPGHLKKAAGERTAESFAPGHGRDDAGMPQDGQDGPDDDRAANQG